MPLRLKSLELHGYKTFANRMSFEFADTITAIVGPNGSGKSNIADSLRWVLGEQSYSLLRAKKTEDMIFSGSENRPRAGMASATITFDNSDGWLPIDFSEVAITRRAYRDGQNEYLINHQRVRLRDVSELLANSGLAERTYTIIGQGLVDAALALRADERRRLFEEAAGIGLHRSRREEALRRLEVTYRNLERVEDILSELRPRLRSLEKQARKAQEYEQVRADMRVLLREWYGYHWHNSQKELAEAQLHARDQEGRLEKTRQEQIKQDKDLLQIRQRIQDLRENLNGWHRHLAELHSRRETISRELAIAEERERSIQGQQQRAQVQILNLDEEIEFHREQMNQFQEEERRLTTELNEARSQVDQSRQALVERQAQRAKEQANLDEARQVLASLNTRQGQLKARQSERAARLERIQQALMETETALSRAEEEYQASQVVLKNARQLVNKLHQAQQAAEKALLDHRKQIENAEQARKERLEQQAALKAEAERQQARLDVLVQAEKALSGYASGTRVLLQAARQQQVFGVRGALNNYLEVPVELENAIAAALGEYLDAIVLQDDPESALDLLQAKLGKGVLMPLENIGGAPALTIDAETDDGILGVAADLVRVSTELRPVVNLLLGRMLVVKDRNVARRLLKGKGAEVSAVTLKGEVFYANGPIRVSGGSGAQGEGTVLSRTRQRRELTHQLTEIQEQLGNLSEQLQEAEAGLARLRSNGRPLEEALERAGQEYETAHSAADQAELDLKAAERQVDWQTDQLRNLQAEFDQASDEAQSFSIELTEIEKQLIQARQRVRQDSSVLDGLTLDDFQSRLAHWNTLAAVAERALDDVETRKSERQTTLERIETTKSDLSSRQEDLAVALENLSASQAANRKEEAEISAQIKNLQAAIEPGETELSRIEREQTELQKVEAAARQAVSVAEHFHAQARIALARRQEALESLRRRIEDDFGLVAFEYVEQVSGPTPLPLEGMVEQLPRVEKISPDLEESIKRQRTQLRRMGAVNPEAQVEYKEVRDRYEFMVEQVEDLKQAEQDVRQVIDELDDLMQREFRKTFDAVATEFREIYTRLFGGGLARLVLTEPEALTTTGIDIEARLPGRRIQGLALFSGGERSLIATALIFSLLKVSPTPFCVLDEVDAMLDESNVGRFRDLLDELSKNTQFVVITHNRNTVQVADVIYGVTMGRDSVSQVLSLKLDEVRQVVD